MFFTTFDQEKKLFSGPKTKFVLDPENASLGKFVLDTLQKNGSKLAQVYNSYPKNDLNKSLNVCNLITFL